MYVFAKYLVNSREMASDNFSFAVVSLFFLYLHFVLQWIKLTYSLGRQKVGKPLLQMQEKANGYFVVI